MDKTEKRRYITKEGNESVYNTIICTIPTHTVILPYYG